jgi:hypothetical protein
MDRAYRTPTVSNRSGSRIFLALGVSDMRKAINGLSILVE